MDKNKSKGRFFDLLWQFLLKFWLFIIFQKYPCSKIKFWFITARPTILFPSFPPLSSLLSSTVISFWLSLPSLLNFNTFNNLISIHKYIFPLIGCLLHFLVYLPNTKHTLITTCTNNFQYFPPTSIT